MDQVHVDHQQRAADVADLRHAAEDMEVQLVGKLRELKEAVRTSTSMFTRSGNPAPMYQALLSQLDTLVERLTKTVHQTGDNIRNDADALQMSQEQSHQVEQGTMQQMGSLNERAAAPMDR